MLEIKNLNKNFGKKEVLKGFTFSFQQGVYGLLGPNGAGKTTLIRCLTQLYPTKGDAIFYNGESVRKSKDYLAHIGYLPQKFGLFRDLKVTEMLELMANLKGMKKQEARPRIRECLELVNLPDRADSKVGALSGGMIRRLGIAQALLSDPELLIFDEPTAGLDPEERLRFKNIVSEVKKGKTILISTHIVEDVEAICDQVAIMESKNIGVSGSCRAIEELAQNKVYLVPEEEKERIQGDYFVQKHLEQDGRKMLKILTGAPQPWPAVPPNVEDGYICVLKHI